ncbi:S49 family peptidase [Candidatus Chlamydia sanziniae]|uniref:Protease n=1 Tax=Candidatus Chlamydia sanziniae TaxID=1806891 RepID=A0A1A9HWD8_9CHLA|nr:S49 family peptidase [Candidatus Chlamydia sanziniae]ANH78412.1 Protease [Candidatus Chlamydia sanziniae]
MKTLWHFLSKAFLSIIGLCCGLVLALIVVMGLVLSTASSTDASFVSLPDAQGVIHDLGKSAPVIAVFEIKDAILSSKNTAKTIQNALEGLDKAPLKNRVKGIIIDMDCPGGEVFEIARINAMLNFWKQRTHCPIYVFVNGLCASGGYYIACAADKIYTTSASLIGSVGVRSGPYFNVKEGLNRYGIESELLTAGNDKAPLNPYTQWTAHDKEVRQNIINFLYEQFIEVVVASRPLLTKERLIHTLGARLYSSQQALEEGYIDVVNVSQQQVLQDMVVACNIDNNYRVIRLDDSGWWKRMTHVVSSSPLITGKIQHELLPIANDVHTVPYLGL